MVPVRPALHARGLATVVAAWMHVSCGGGSPAPPPTAPAPTVPEATTVTGRERLAWTYDAQPGVVSFRAYVDGAPVDLTDPTCQAEGNGHACSASLPALSLGVHVIAVSAVTAEGAEGERSAPITVQMVTRTTAAGTVTSVGGAEATASPFAVDLVMTDVPWPVQLAALPDGRVLVGQGDGRVRAFHGAGPVRVTEALDATTLFDPPPRGGVSLTAAPLSDAARGHVFLSYVAHDDDGSRRLSVVRMRDVDGRLGEPAAILDAALAPPPDGVADAAAQGSRIATGPDGLLYVLLPDGATLDGHATAAGPSAAVVRLTPDGRPEPFEPGSMSTRPRVMGWMPASGALQMIDGTGRQIGGVADVSASASARNVLTSSLLEVVTGGQVRGFRLNAATVGAWSRVAGDLAAWRSARGTTRLLDAVDVSAVLPALPGLVEDAVYADGVAYLATRRPGSTTSTVVRVTVAAGAVAR